MKLTFMLLISFISYLLLSSGLALGAETSQSNPNIVRIAVDEWPPYETESAEHFGGLLRIITESFAHNGLKVKYGWMPWKRCLIVAERGEWDGAAVSQRTREREDNFFFSESIMTVRKVFFHLKTIDFDWDSYDDLGGFRIGIPRGNVFGKDFQKARKTEKLDIEEVATQFEQNFKKLHAGRIQLFPAEMEAGYDYLRKHYASEFDFFTHHPTPVQVVTYHLILSKKVEKNLKMKSLFDVGLRQLKKEGKDKRYLLDSIQGKYRKQ